MTDELTEIEAIKQLKSRYFRLMDTQQFDDWHTCFTDDVTATYEGAPRASDDLPVDIRIAGCADLVGGSPRANDWRAVNPSRVYAGNRTHERDECKRHLVDV